MKRTLGRPTYAFEARQYVVSVRGEQVRVGVRMCVVAQPPCRAHALACEMIMMNDGGARSFSTRRLLMRWNILTSEAGVCAWLGVGHMAPTRAVPETKGGRSW